MRKPTQFNQTPKHLRESEAEARDLPVCGMTLNERELVLLRFPHLGDFECWYAKWPTREKGMWLRRVLYYNQERIWNAWASVNGKVTNALGQPYR